MFFFRIPLLFSSGMDNRGPKFSTAGRLPGVSPSVNGPNLQPSFQSAEQYFEGIPGNEHEALPRFKMCAITQVDVNYTPDGTYATYYDGQPVAVQLTISFQETKLVFSEEIGSKEGIR